MLSKALKLQEASSFVTEWLKAPLVTGSILPSSRGLARSMVQGVPADARSVVELGPGTGVFTEQLLAAGIKEESLVLVELNGKFANELRRKYPKADVINGAAEALDRFSMPKADVVISGLPLLSMRDEQVGHILKGVFTVLKAEGVLVQFTYGYRCPVRKALLKTLDLSGQRKRFVLNNFPPASVYHIRKQSSAVYHEI